MQKIDSEQGMATRVAAARAAGLPDSFSQFFMPGVDGVLEFRQPSDSLTAAIVAPQTEVETVLVGLTRGTVHEVSAKSVFPRGGGTVG